MAIATAAPLIDVLAILILSEGVLDSIDDLLPATAIPDLLVATSVATIEKLVEFSLVNFGIALALLDLLLELINLIEVLTLLLVTLSLLVSLDSLVKLLVLHALLLLFERLHLLLLLKEAGLDLSHVLVRLQHLREEVIRSRYRHLSLHQDLHTLHHIFPGQVVEGYLTLDVVVHCQGLGDN